MKLIIVINNTETREYIRWCLDNLTDWCTCYDDNDDNLFMNAFLDKTSEEWFDFIVKHGEYKPPNGDESVAAHMIVKNEDEASLLKLRWG